jgi:hypothetical protein
MTSEAEKYRKKDETKGMVYDVNDIIPPSNQRKVIRACEKCLKWMTSNTSAAEEEYEEPQWN